MAFYPEGAVVPGWLRADEFLVRPLRATDVEADYDAVVSSRAELWLRSGGRWPREGFTLAENLADLEGHEREHREGVAFTFTVMDPTETECLGCVYINPLARMLERAGATGGQKVSAGEHDAWVTFWVRQSRLADGLDGRLLRALVGWSAAEWAFSRVVFAATRAQERQIRLFEAAGMRPTYDLPNSVAYNAAVDAVRVIV